MRRSKFSSSVFEATANFTYTHRQRRWEDAMAGIDRRNFLTRGSMVVAAAGVATAVPGFASDLVAAGPDAPTLEADAGALEESLVVHVRDLSSGEIGVFS